MHQLRPDNWIKEYSDELYFFIQKRISDSETAKDILQDSFLSAWKGRNMYKGDASERSWLYSICKNKIIDHYRKSASNASLISLGHSEDDVFFDEHGNWNKNAQPGKWGSTDRSSIEIKEFYSILERCKKDLNETQRAVFVLKYLDDAQADDICKELNITSSNYWILLHRARLKMRMCMEKKWFEKK